MNKPEWEKTHGASGVPVQGSWKDLGWKWIPKVCHHRVACWLNMDKNTREGKN